VGGVGASPVRLSHRQTNRVTKTLFKTIDYSVKTFEKVENDIQNCPQYQKAQFSQKNRTEKLSRTPRKFYLPTSDRRLSTHLSLFMEHTPGCAKFSQ
jgi:hypothetical protein